MARPIESYSYYHPTKAHHFNAKVDSLTLDEKENLRIVINQLTLEEKIAQLFLLHLSEDMSTERKRQFEKFVSKYGVGALVHDDIQVSRNILSPKVKLIRPILGVNILNKKVLDFMHLPAYSFNSSSSAKQYGISIGKIIQRANRDFVWFESSKAGLPQQNAYCGENMLSFIDGLNQSNLLSFGCGEVSQKLNLQKGIKKNEAFLLSKYFLGYDFFQTKLYKEKNKQRWVYKIPKDKIKIREDYYGLCLTPNIEKHALNSQLIKLILTSNDWITFPKDPQKTLVTIKKMIKKNEINRSLLDRKVLRILDMKRDFLYDKNQAILKNNVDVNLTKKHVKLEVDKFYFSTVSLARDQSNFIPIRKIDSTQFFVESFSESTATSYLPFKKYISSYVPLSDLDLEKGEKKSNSSSKKEKVIIIPVFNSTLSPDAKSKKNNSNNILSKQKEFEKNIYEQKKRIDEKFEKVKLIWVFFGEILNSSSVNKYFDANDILIHTPFENKILARDIPAIIFGGKFLDTENEHALLLKEKKTYTPRLAYTPPEELGIHTYLLEEKISQLVHEGIKKKAFPGAQILIARKGKIIYHKDFGRQSYKKNAPQVNNQTIYDLASLTKVLSTTQVLMHLQHLGKLDVNKTLGDYVNELKGTNKEDLTIKDVLLHRAGLLPIVKVKRLLSQKNGNLKKKYFGIKKDELNNIQLTNHLFTNSRADSLIWAEIKVSPLRHKKYHRGAGYTYKYSDLGFVLLQKVCEQITQTPIDIYVTQHVYNRIGASTLRFNPLKKNNVMLSDIVPTEIDFFFRKGEIHGIVNDPIAAIMGGVAGHAGLFGTALDVAKVMELSRNNGTYGGIKPIYTEKIMNFFNAYHLPNHRRGLGWDKPHYKDRKDERTPVTALASVQTFGHLGFTGTCTWVDPEKDLLFVFLSNRTYPKSDNSLLQELDIRNKIFDVVYYGIEKYEMSRKLASN